MSAVNRSLPEPFLKRMRELLCERFPLYLDTMEQEPVKALYAQADRLEPSLLLKRPELKLTLIPFVENGFYCSAEKPGNHPLHAAGAFYVQDPSAMLPVAASPLRPGMSCLDLCASPGGKSAQIRSRIGENGFLLSNEIMPARCKVLAGNLERIGAVRTVVSNADARRIASWYPSYFDFVLVDAPCSGEGMFRKYPESVSEWNEKLPAYCAERQKTLLTEAVKTLAPEGYLLYSTCTFSTEENEDVVRFLLENEPALALTPFPDWVCSVTDPGIGYPECRRFYPFLAPGEGQFMALFRKAEGGTRSETPAFPDARAWIGRQEMDAAVSFLENTLDSYAELPLCRYGDRIVAADEPIPSGNIYAAGVAVGEIAKNRLIPHHALFKAYGGNAFRKWELDPDDPALDGYLSGRELPCPLEDGWGVVTTLNCPVGGIKVVDQTAKNHYPKGLRRP